MATEPARAFVLMPFDPEFTAIYEQLIRPSLEDAGYEAWRADSVLDQQNILRDVVRGLATADLVVADLTTLNSNVLYELGLAHGLQVPTVLLTQSLDEVPFDLRSYRIIPYSTNFDQVGKLRTALGEVAAAHRAGTITFGSPIIDFYTVEGGNVPHRVVATRDEEEEEATPVEGEVVEEEPPGFLESQVEAMEASERLIALFQAFTLETQQLTTGFEAKLPAVEETAASTDPGAARRMLVLGHELSQMLLRYGEGLEELLPEFEEHLDTFLDRSERVIQSATIGSQEDLEATQEARKAAEELLEGSRENLQVMREQRMNVEDFGAGASREMTRTGQRVARIVDRYIAALERLEAFSSRMLFLYDGKIQEWSRDGGADTT